MKIIIDSREQWPFPFEDFPCSVEVGSLPTGDYSLAGLESMIAIERKSLSDLLGCLTTGRERFTRELERGRGMSFFAVIVESPLSDLRAGQYRSRMNPRAAVASVLSLSIRNRCPFYFCADRDEAEAVTYDLLRLFLEGTQKRLAAIVKAHGLPISPINAPQGPQVGEASL